MPLVNPLSASDLKNIIENLPEGTPKSTDALAFVDIDPAVSRVVTGTATGAGTVEETVTIGELTGEIGTDIDEGADEIEFAGNIVAWINAESEEATAVDNEDGTFDITFPAGANEAEVSTTDGVLTFEETTAGTDEVTEIKRADVSALGGGITNSAAENNVPKTDGDGNLVSSVISDDGTNVDINTGAGGTFSAGDINGDGDGTVITVNDTNKRIILNADDGVHVNGTNIEEALSVSAYKTGDTTRDTDTPTADPHLSVTLAAGNYLLNALLFWDFGGDGATLTFNGGAATISDSLLQWRAFAPNDDTSPTSFFVFKGTNADAPTYDLTNAGFATITVNGVITVSVAGTFAFKWGGVNSGGNHTLQTMSFISLTKI